VTLTAETAGIRPQTPAVAWQDPRLTYPADPPPTATTRRSSLPLPSRGLQLAWWGQWAAGWSSITSFAFAGRPSHLLYNSSGGTAQIDIYHA